MCIGVDSSALDSEAYQVSVSTFETYLAIVNVSDSSLYGEWQLNITSVGSYNIRITAASDLDFTYTLYRLDPTSNFGFASLEQNPLEGNPHLAVNYTCMHCIADLFLFIFQYCLADDHPYSPYR